MADICTTKPAQFAKGLLAKPWSKFLPKIAMVLLLGGCQTRSQLVVLAPAEPTLPRPKPPSLFSGVPEDAALLVSSPQHHGIVSEIGDGRKQLSAYVLTRFAKDVSPESLWQWMSGAGLDLQAQFGLAIFRDAAMVRWPVADLGVFLSALQSLGVTDLAGGPYGGVGPAIWSGPSGLRMAILPGRFATFLLATENRDLAQLAAEAQRRIEQGIAPVSELADKWQIRVKSASLPPVLAAMLPSLAPTACQNELAQLAAYLPEIRAQIFWSQRDSSPANICINATLAMEASLWRAVSSVALPVTQAPPVIDEASEWDGFVSISFDRLFSHTTSLLSWLSQNPPACPSFSWLHTLGQTEAAPVKALATSSLSDVRGFHLSLLPSQGRPMFRGELQLFTKSPLALVNLLGAFHEKNKNTAAVSSRFETLARDFTAAFGPLTTEFKEEVLLLGLGGKSVHQVSPMVQSAVGPFVRILEKKSPGSQQQMEIAKTENNLIISLGQGVTASQCTAAQVVEVDQKGH